MYCRLSFVKLIQFVYVKPSDTMEMWDQSDDQNAQVEEEKGRTEDQRNKVINELVYYALN